MICIISLMSKSENRKILKLLISVGLPIAIQNLLSNGINLIDNFMVGSLSEDALSAVSLANRSYFIFVMLLFGLISGIGIYSSQYYGSKEIPKIHSMMGIGFTFGVSFAILLTILISLFPDDTVRIFIKDESVVSIGTEYIKIAVLSFIPASISMVFQINLRSVRMTKIPMMTSLVAAIFNGLLNYILIFGKLGLPALGVKGAAIATVTARFIELVMVLLFVFLNKNCPLKGTIKSYFSYTLPMMVTVFRRSLPVVLQEGLWAIGTSVYFIAYGNLSSASVAAAQISLTSLDIYISLFIGLGNGAGVMVGNLLGEKEVEKAQRYSNKIILYQIILSIPFAILFSFSGIWITRFLNFSVAGNQATLYTIYVLAAYLPIKCMNFLFIVGILRGGGDTRFCMLSETASVWLIGVPLAFISVLVLKLPIYWCVALVNLEEITKLILCSVRYKSKKWINVLVD